MENKEIPMVSMLRFYTSAKRILKNPLPFYHENFEKFGDTFQLKIGFGKKIIFSRNVRFAKYVLQKNHEQGKEIYWA